MKLVLERTDQFLKILKGTIEQQPMKLTDVEYHEGRGKDIPWEKFPVGAYWGKHDTWYRFRTIVVIPQEYEGKRVRCRLVAGREGMAISINPQFLVRVNGKVEQAMDTNHYTFDVVKNAQAGEAFELEFEAYAGREQNNILIKDQPLQFNLRAFWHDAESEKLYYDLYTARKSAELFSADNYNRIIIEKYLTNALNLIDCRQVNSEAYFESIRAAATYMEEEFYGKVCGEYEAIANCVGHTHIDVAWKWTLEQTRAKAVRSFSTELRLLDEYPEHMFTSSQPQLYQYVKEDCPEVYEQIKERVKEGRWEVEGAMWLEADCNLSSGESLIRQILHGKRFMKEEFGVDSKVLWLPDVFGYSAALPQILQKTGVDTFVTSKIHWNDTNHFPYDTFMWKGIDGTELFTQFITAGSYNAKMNDKENFRSTYNSMLTPLSVARGWEIYQQKDINNEFMVTFGWGDGGGGVTRDMMEMQRRMCKGIPGVPKTRITTVADTIARIKENVKDQKIPKWFGELYLEFHRATYTSIAKNKRFNRICEFLLQHNETVSLANKVLLGGQYPKKDLYDSWQIVLLNQFHDIIPGSSIEEVYDDSDVQYAEVIAQNEKSSGEAISSLAANVDQAGVFVYNPTGMVQSGIVEVDGIKYFAEDVPAYGWKVIAENAASDACEDTGLYISTGHMENAFFAIDLDEKGTFTRIYDKRNEREVLTEGARGNVFQAFDDHPPIYDNWELSVYHKEIMWEIDNVDSIEVIEKTAVSASLKIVRKFLSSTITQIITIYKDIPRIDFDTQADWHEHHIFVKVAFPVDILSDKATYEIQYGAVERPTHFNTSWDSAKFEVCAHKWADFAEAGYGVALMNDCKYGYDIHDGVMCLSLIKCGTNPNPNADQGEHIFKYSLMPHSGDWREAQIVKEAFALNCPLIGAKTAGEGQLSANYSFANVNTPNVIISSIKEACDGEDIIVRAYEAHGMRTKTALNFGFNVAAASEVDMLEEAVYEELSVANNGFTTIFKPYEIKTFRIKR